MKVFSWITLLLLTLNLILNSFVDWSETLKKKFFRNFKNLFVYFFFIMKERKPKVFTNAKYQINICLGVWEVGIYWGFYKHLHSSINSDTNNIAIYFDLHNTSFEGKKPSCNKLNNYLVIEVLTFYYCLRRISSTEDSYNEGLYRF